MALFPFPHFIYYQIEGDFHQYSIRKIKLVQNLELNIIWTKQKRNISMFEVLRFIQNHFMILWFICFGWVLVSMGFLLYIRKKKGIIFPELSNVTVLHQEHFASGRSLDAKFKGGASNCLKVIVTDKEIRTTPFSISAIIYLFGLENWN
jgi:hypothetical protein